MKKTLMLAFVSLTIGCGVGFFLGFVRGDSLGFLRGIEMTETSRWIHDFTNLRFAEDCLAAIERGGENRDALLERLKESIRFRAESLRLKFNLLPERDREKLRPAFDYLKRAGTVQPNDKKQDSDKEKEKGKGVSPKY